MSRPTFLLLLVEGIDSLFDFWNDFASICSFYLSSVHSVQQL